MGKAKKIGLGIGIVIGVFIVLGVVSSALVRNSNPDDSPDSSTLGANTVVDTSGSQPSDNVMPESSATGEVAESVSPTTPIEDMLPQRQDIGTEWILKGVGTVNATEDGFEAGVEQGYTGKGALVTVTIFQFDSASSAMNYQQAVTTDLYNRGGYQEIDMDDIENTNCYSTSWEGYTGARQIDSYCVKDKIYFHTKAYVSSFGEPEEVQEIAQLFAEATAKRA